MSTWIAFCLSLAFPLSALAQGTAPGFLDADHWDGGRPEFIYTHLGLRLDPENVAEEFRGLDMDERLARVEALELGWDRLSDAEIKDRQLAISRLYGTSPFVKHRVWSADDLDVFLHAGSLPLPEALLRAQCYESMGNPWQSIRALERAARAFPNRARAWRELGRSRLELALQTWDQEGYERARQDFLRALQCDDRTPRDFLGLASVLVAQGNAAGVDALAPALLADPALRPGSTLLAAWAAERSGRPVDAEALFREAIASLDEVGRRVFEGGDVAFAVTEMDPMLQPMVSPGTRRWWVRLVETEVLFGDPRLPINGWSEGPGSAYLRYGPPVRQKSVPNSMGLTELMEACMTQRYRIAHEMGDNSYWVWIYELPGLEFPLVFQRNAPAGKWLPSPYSFFRQKMAERAIPAYLPPTTPEVGFQVALRTAAFKGTQGRARLEAYLGIRSIRSDLRTVLQDSFSVDLVLRDLSGQDVATHRRVVDRSSTRAEILRRVGEASADSTYQIAVFTSELDPGRHTLHLRVQNLVTGELRSAKAPLQVRPFGQGFRMSDLQVCDVFQPTAHPASLPSEWRRIDRALVPQPDATIPEARNEVLLYFEAYGATVDAQSFAEIQVSYRIYRASDYRRIRNALVDTTAPLPVDEARFPVESVRALANGSVFKGTRVQLDGLEGGNYAVVVDIVDVTSGESAEGVAYLRRW